MLKLKRTTASANNKLAVKGLSPYHFLRFGLLLAVLLALVFGVVFYFIVGSSLLGQEQMRGRQLSEWLATQQQSVLNAEVAQVRDRLLALSTTPAIERVSSFEHRDPRKVSAAHRLFESNLLKTFPEALSFHYIPMNELGVAGIRNRSQFRNNIELDIIQRAWSSKSSQIEAYRHEKAWLVSFAQWAESGSVLMVVVPAEHFSQIMQSVAAGELQVELRQDFQGARHTIARVTGSGAGEISVARPLDVPGWTIEVRLSSKIEQGLRIDSTMVWLLFVLAVVSILTAGILPTGLAERWLNKDIANFANTPASKLRLPAIAELKRKLLSRSKSTRRKSGGATSAAAVARPPSTAGLVVEEVDNSKDQNA